jgi:hypothetical protein
MLALSARVAAGRRSVKRRPSDAAQLTTGECRDQDESGQRCATIPGLFALIRAREDYSK